MMTGEEAWQGLAALVGAGGISGILIAFFGFKTAAMKGRTDPTSGTSVAMSVGDALVPRATFEALTTAIIANTSAIQKNAVLLEAMVSLEQKELERNELRNQVKDLLKEMQKASS